MAKSTPKSLTLRERIDADEAVIASAQAVLNAEGNWQEVVDKLEVTGEARDTAAEDLRAASLAGAHDDITTALARQQAAEAQQDAWRARGDEVIAVLRQARIDENSARVSALASAVEQGLSGISDGATLRAQLEHDVKALYVKYRAIEEAHASTVREAFQIGAELGIHRDPGAGAPRRGDKLQQIGGEDLNSGSARLVTSTGAEAAEVLFADDFPRTTCEIIAEAASIAEQDRREVIRRTEAEAESARQRSANDAAGLGRVTDAEVDAAERRRMYQAQREADRSRGSGQSVPSSQTFERIPLYSNYMPTFSTAQY